MKNLTTCNLMKTHENRIHELLTVCVEEQCQGFLQTLVVHDALDGQVTEQPRLEEQRARHYRRAVTLVVDGRNGRSERSVVPADVPHDLCCRSGLGGAVCLSDSRGRSHLAHLWFG